MRKIILYTAVSLDNFIAKPDGNIDWLHDPAFALENEDFGYKEFYESIDTTLMGLNTFKLISAMPIPFPYLDKDNFVFSRSNRTLAHPHVNYIHKDIIGFTRSLKNLSGKDIWLVGGSQINTLLLDNQLIDQMIITIVPLLLGEGIPLFQGSTESFQLTRTNCHTFDNGFVQIYLDVRI